MRSKDRIAGVTLTGLMQKCWRTSICRASQKASPERRHPRGLNDEIKHIDVSWSIKCPKGHMFEVWSRLLDRSESDAMLIFDCRSHSEYEAPLSDHILQSGFGICSHSSQCNERTDSRAADWSR